MSFLSDNVIPGNHGKVFGTNAKTKDELKEIKIAVLEVDGIKDVILNSDDFPFEFTVHTSKVVHIRDIEKKAKTLRFHAVPKGLFHL